MIAAVLGMDPGHRGAADVLGETGAPMRAWSWRPLDRKSGRVYRIDDETAAGLQQTEVRHLALVGAAIGEALWQMEADGLLGGWHLAVEGLFVHGMARGDTAIELGRTVGWLTASFVHRALSYDDPRARKWRPAVLGCSPTASSDEAERLALMRWRARWAGELATDEHVAEADGIASYRRGMLQRERAQLALVESARKRRASR
jgi:hypothetical protein